MNRFPSLGSVISRPCSLVLATLLGFALLHAEVKAQSDKDSVKKADGSKGRNELQGKDQEELLSLSMVISWREEHIRRLVKEMNRNKDKPDADSWHSRVEGVARSLVELHAVEAVPTLCEQISEPGNATRHIRPVAVAVSEFGASALPGIHQSLEESLKTELEIRLFAFILRQIDRGVELTVFRLELEIKKRTEETERNTTFKENARKLLKCFATPDFFRFKNNPFYFR